MGIMTMEGYFWVQTKNTKKHPELNPHPLIILWVPGHKFGDEDDLLPMAAGGADGRLDRVWAKPPASSSCTKLCVRLLGVGPPENGCFWETFYILLIVVEWLKSQLNC